MSVSSYSLHPVESGSSAHLYSVRKAGGYWLSQLGLWAGSVSSVTVKERWRGLRIGTTYDGRWPCIRSHIVSGLDGWPSPIIPSGGAPGLVVSSKGPGLGFACEGRAVTGATLRIAAMMATRHEGGMRTMVCV